MYVRIFTNRFLILVEFTQMKARLSGGHFRMLNEKLYTCSYVYLLRKLLQFFRWIICSNIDAIALLFLLSRGDEALNYFKENPELFNVVRIIFSNILYFY